MKDTTRQHLKAYAMIAPAMALFAVFIGLPAFLALVIGFKKIDLTAGITGSPWVGLQNFRDIFGNVLLQERIITAFKNTLLFTICFVPANLFLSVTLASLINALGDKRQALYRAAFYLPTVTSAIVFGMIWKWLYDYNNGLLNYFISLFGHDKINWTGDPDWALWSVIVASIGMGPGGNVLIYLAALGSVPTESMESARVEGANPLQAWWHVVLPSLKPVTLYLLVLNTIGSFQVFELVFILTSGGPAGSSTVIVYEIYDLAFGQGRYGAAGALALILLLIVASISFLQFYFLGGNAEETKKATWVTHVAEAISGVVSRALGTIGNGAADAWAKLRGPRRNKLEKEYRPSTFKDVLKEMPVHIILAPLALLFLFPMAWMFLSAFTPTPYLQSNPPQVSLANMTVENYQHLFKAAPTMGRWVWNSAYLSILITVVQVTLSCLTGYVFARISFPGRSVIFALLLGSILLPGQALLIPLFLVISSGIRNVLHIDLMDTHWALILPGLCSPVGIFLMRQFIQGIPKDLDEAARIDGCGEFAVWWRVILPLCRPILGAWAILTFTGVWRSFFWPFVVLGYNNLFTLEVGLQTLQQQNGQDFGMVMAGATLSAVPMIVIFFIFQKQIVRGLTFGAVKG